MFKRFLFAVAIVSLVALLPAQSTSAQWVGTWASAPRLAEGDTNVRMLSGTTLREIAHISAGGTQVRIRFTNQFGLDPLTISDAHVALSDGAVLFDPALTIPSSSMDQRPSAFRPEQPLFRIPFHSRWLRFQMLLLASTCHLK